MVGLVVIVAFCLYTAFAVFVARRVGRLAKSRLGQNTLIASVLVVLYLAPIADGIYGYFVLQHLCATEAKTEVLKPIRLPPEYFNSDGSPTFVDKEFRRVNWKFLRAELEIKRYETLNYQIQSLDRVQSTLVNFRTNEVMARHSDFYYRGGWLQYNGAGMGKSVCLARPSFDEVILGSGTKK